VFRVIAPVSRRLPGRRTAPQVVWSVREDPDALGYILAPDPLLGVMPEAEWRELERSATLAA
jgi:hypothetical protein